MSLYYRFKKDIKPCKDFKETFEIAIEAWIDDKGKLLKNVDNCKINVNDHADKAVDTVPELLIDVLEDLLEAPGESIVKSIDVKIFI